MKKVKIRVASLEDAEELLEIYGYYVKNTAISFEYDVPTVQEFRNRISNTLLKYPYLVAELEGKIVGYAYASDFHKRAAYAWNVETTIYVRQDMKRMCIGRLLYKELERVLSCQGILNLNACIGYPRIEDEYLTRASVRFHEHMGFKLVAKFNECGYKFNRWYGIVWMEKHIGEHVENPKPVISFSELRRELNAK